MCLPPPPSLYCSFAFELARRGWNVLLVSRSEKKLKELAASIAAKHPKVKTALVVSDAAASGMSEVDAVVAAVRALPASGALRILVNNVGVATDWPRLFEDCSSAELEGLVAVNCRYSTLLTHALLPFLKDKPEGHKAAIVNLSSLSAFAHVAYLAVYSATKAFNLAFSHALRDELHEKNHGMEVLALTPGFVASHLSGFSAASVSLWVCSAEACASAGLNAIGLRDHSGYWVHHLTLHLLAPLVPARIQAKADAQSMKAFADRKIKQQLAEKEASAKQE